MGKCEDRKEKTTPPHAAPPFPLRAPPSCRHHRRRRRREAEAHPRGTNRRVPWTQKLLHLTPLHRSQSQRSRLSPPPPRPAARSQLAPPRGSNRRLRWPQFGPTRSPVPSEAGHSSKPACSSPGRLIPSGRPPPEQARPEFSTSRNLCRVPVRVVALEAPWESNSVHIRIVLGLGFASPTRI